jgi:hypothetical protein
MPLMGSREEVAWDPNGEVKGERQCSHRVRGPEASSNERHPLRLPREHGLGDGLSTQW